VPSYRPYVTILHADVQADPRDGDIMVRAVKVLLEVYSHFKNRGLDLVGLADMNDDQLLVSRSPVSASYPFI
jgi:hypothetical protein